MANGASAIKQYSMMDMMFFLCLDSRTVDQPRAAMQRNSEAMSGINDSH